MSKKKSLSGLKETFEAIKGEKKAMFVELDVANVGPDLLIRTKAQLDDTTALSRPSLVQDLHQVASLAESFTEQRPKSSKEWFHLADTLDQEGAWQSLASLIRLLTAETRRQSLEYIRPRSQMSRG